MTPLAYLDAIYKLADRSAVDLKLDAALTKLADDLGLDGFEVERKAAELTQYGGPVIYYP